MIGLLLTMVLASADVPPAYALELRQFNVEAGDAAAAIHELGLQSGVQIMASGTRLAGRRLNAVSGELTTEEALKRLLAGTGLTHRYMGERAVAVVSEQASTRPAAAPSGASSRLDPSSRGESFQLARADRVNAAEAAAPGAAHSTSTDPEALQEVLVLSKRPFRPKSSSAASKLELDVMDTPQALTLLGSEFLSAADLNDTASVVAYTAGLEATGVADGTEAYIVARGFTVDRYRSFRINGLSVYSEIDVDYYTMDRVEIVRGPASSLYGEADYGATVNRVLKAPGNRFAASLGAQMGSFDLRRIEGDVQGVLNDSGSLTGRAVGLIQESDTVVDATEDNRWVVAPSLRYEFGDSELLVQGYYSKITGPSSDGFALIRDPEGSWVVPDVPRSRNYAASTNDIDSSNAFYFARLTHRFSDTLKGTLSGGFSDVRMDNNSSYLCDCDAVEGDGIADLYYFLERKTQQNTSFDLSLEKSFTALGRDQRLLVSADWRRNTALQPLGPGEFLGSHDFVAQGGPYQATQPDLNTGNFVDEFSRYYGVSLLAYLKPTDRFSTLIGLRYAGIKSGLYGYFDGAIVDGGEDETWVPRLGLMYRLEDSHRFFLSYSEGIIFNATFRDVNRNAIRPERGIQYEAGFKGEFFADRLFYSLSAFTIDREDVAKRFIDPDDPDPIGPPVYLNVGRQTHRGIDLELQGEPIPGFNILLSYAFLDVTVKESANPAEVGNTPGFAPKNSFSVFGTYEFLSGPLESLSLGGGYISRSEREIDNYGTFRLPAYDRVDLRAAYDITDRLGVELNVVNALDEEIVNSAYDAAIFGISFSDARSYSLGATYRF
jgi:TonB-dependent siderophore receptor